MEKFNPNKKNWEPLYCDLTVRRQRMKITIYTKKGEQISYENVNDFNVHDVGPGLLAFRHDERCIEYYRLGTIDRWTVEVGSKPKEAENE